MMGNLDHRLDHRRINTGHDTTIVDDGIITPLALKHKGEQKDQCRGNNGLDTEFGAKNPCADNEQGDIHADGIERNLPWPQGVEHVGKAIGTTRRHQVRVNKHHVANGKQQATNNQQEIGYHLLP